MKINSILLVLIAFIFISCDELEELNQVDVKSTISQEGTITLSEDTSDFSENVVLNLSSSVELTPLLNRIEKIEIEEAYYELTNYEGADEATGSIEIVSSSQVFGPFSHNFSQDVQSGTQFNLANSTKLNILATNLKNANTLTISVSGSQDPSQNGSLDVKVTLKLKVTANVL